MPVLERLFNGPSIPARGGMFAVDSALPNMEKPFTAFFGASQRMIVDLADLDRRCRSTAPGSASASSIPIGTTRSACGRASSTTRWSSDGPRATVMF